MPNITHNLINTKHKITSNLLEIIETVRKFNDNNNWKKFKNAKDLTLALPIKARELKEVYLWKKGEMLD